MDTAGKNAKAIAEYIKHQLDKDKIQDQITMKEFVDPFKGTSNKPLADDRPYKAPAGAASNIGLCPHMKTPGCAGVNLVGNNRTSETFK